MVAEGKIGLNRESQVYYGETSTRLDEKGRITVPRNFRETMDTYDHAVWYMTRGFDRCVFLFHKEAWNRIQEQVSRFNSMDARVLDFRRLFFSGVAKAKPDNQGRMPIPQHLRDHAELDKEVVLIGVEDHLELWEKERWLKFLSDKEALYKEMAAPVFATFDEVRESEQEKGDSDA